MQAFLVLQLNEKWSEEMPVLYDYYIYIQDEFLETYIDQNSQILDGNKILRIDF